MTDKQEVIGALNAMPDNVSLDEIIEELRIMNAVRRAGPPSQKAALRHKRR